MLLLHPYYFPSIICVHPRVLAHKLVVVFVSPIASFFVTLATDLFRCVGSLVLFGLTMVTTWHARGISAAGCRREVWARCDLDASIGPASPPDLRYR